MTKPNKKPEYTSNEIAGAIEIGQIIGGLDSRPDMEDVVSFVVDHLEDQVGLPMPERIKGEMRVQIADQVKKDGVLEKVQLIWDRQQNKKAAYAAASNVKREIWDDRPNDQIAEDLKEFAQAYTEPNTFKAGDLVEYKDARYAIARAPAIGQPAVILKNLITDGNLPVGHLDHCSFNKIEDTIGMTSYKASVNYDIVIGVRDADGDYVGFLAESWRFKRYQDK